MNIIAIDIETSGLEMNCDINFIGFYNGKDYYVIDCVNKTDEEVKEKLNKTLTTLKEKDYKFVYHNGKFDAARILYRYGIDLPLHHDVMILAYLCASASELKEHRKNLLSLKTLAKNILRAPDWDISLDKKKSTSAYDVIPYLQKDLKYTYELFFILSKELPKTRRKTYSLIMSALEAYKRIEVNGMPLDVDLLEKTYNDMKTEMESLYEYRLKKYDINFNSSKQLSELLYNKLGLTPPKITDKGNPSTDIESLSELLGKHEIIEDILEYRKYKKAVEFLTEWRESKIGNKIHANFNLSSTITGRTSCSNPNLQQIPRNKKLKTIFRSTDPEWEFVQMDYSQMELRIAAAVAGVSNMRQAYVNDEDLHTKMASFIAGKKPEEVTKEERSHAKPANFGYLYGMQAKTFVTYAKLNYGVVFSDYEAQRIRDAFFAANYELLDFYKSVEHELLNNCKVTSMMSREYEVSPDDLLNHYWRSEWIRRAINFKVQSTASDIALCAIIEIDQKLPRDRVKICGSVHDSILFLVKKTPHFVDDINLIKHIMEHPILVEKMLQPGAYIDVPLKADVEIGPWGQGKSLEEYIKEGNLNDFQVQTV